MELRSGCLGAGAEPGSGAHPSRQGLFSHMVGNTAAIGPTEARNLAARSQSDGHESRYEASHLHHTGQSCRRVRSELKKEPRTRRVFNKKTCPTNSFPQTTNKMGVLLVRKGMLDHVGSLSL